MMSRTLYYFFFIFFACFTCFNAQAINHEPTGVQLILHIKKTQWKVGEEIISQLQIVNNSENSIQFSGFSMSWKNLKVSGNHKASFVGPDGKNLLAPFHFKEREINEAEIITVAPKKEVWEKLVFSNHLHFHQTGKYQFSIELEDNNGNSYKSNVLELNITKDTSDISADRLSLVINLTEAPTSNNRLKVTAKIANHSDKNVKILKAQQGSVDNIINPYYEFVLTDKNGKGIGKTYMSCDMIIPPEYNEKNTIVLSLNESFSQEITLPKYIDLKSGKYNLELHYLVYHTGVVHGRKTEPMNWEPHVFVGDLKSNSIELTIK